MANGELPALVRGTVGDGRLPHLLWPPEFCQRRRLPCKPRAQKRAFTISREPFASGAMEHSSPLAKLFDTVQLDPKSSLSIAWLRIAVLAPGMCRLLGSALVAWSQQTSSRPDASWTPCPGPVATYLPRA